MLLAVTYMIIYGVYCTIGAMMSNLLNPFGYGPSEISIIGGTCLISGVIGALLIGVFLDRTSLYRKTHITITVMAVFASLWFMFVLKRRRDADDASITPIMLAIVATGVSMVSFFPSSLSYAAELTFPLQPAIVNACMNLMGQLYAFLMMGLATFITDIDATNLESPASIEER